jgi:hypothetical protein
MTKGTRTFVVAAVAILGIGLTTGLVASYMGLPVAVFSSAAGPDELKYVPQDAAVVAYANVRELMDSDLRQRLRKLEPNTQERDEFEQRTGLDIERDIDAVVASMLPTTARSADSPATSHDNHRPLVLARGRFDKVRLEGLAREHGGSVTDYKGVRLITHKGDGREAGPGREPGDGREARAGREPHEMALGFLEAGVVAIGTAEAVRRAIDTREDGRNVLSNTELMRLVGDMDQSNAWAAGRFDAIAQDAQLPSEFRSQLPPVSWFSASGHVNGGVSGLFKAEARDEEAAQNLRDMARGFMAMVKMQAGSQPGMKAMVDSLQLGGEGKTVAVAFQVPSEVFEALEAAAAQRKLQGER